MFLWRISSEELLPLKSEFRRVWKKKGNEKLTFYIYKTFRYSKVGSKNFRVPSLVKLIIFHFEWKISNIIPYMYPVNIPRKSLQIKLDKKGDKYVYRSTKDLPFCESTVTTVNTSHSLEPFARSSFTVFLRCDFTHAPFFHPLPRLLFSFFLLSYKLVKLSPSRSNLIPLITRSNPPSFLSVCPLLSCRFALFTSSRDIYPNIFVPRIHVRLIGAVFPPSIALVVFSSYPRSFHIEISPLVVVRVETIFLIFSLERFLRNSRDWRFPS